LHLSANAGGVTGAELLSEEINPSVLTPAPAAGLLVDDTHGCTGSEVPPQLTTWESAVVAAGIPVAHLTGPVTAAALHSYRALAVIRPLIAYAPAEVQAIFDFVYAGGGLLTLQDWGIDPRFGAHEWSWPTRSVIGAFGLTDNSDFALDQLHNETGNAMHVVFEVGRNFGVHPIVDGLNAITLPATCTFSAGSPWTSVVVTDGDTLPPGRAVVVEREVGAGRVLVLGDSNIIADTWIGERENATFGTRCAERVTFRI
jgi:hypothetical protein